MNTGEKILFFVMLIVIAILVWVTRCPQTQAVYDGASNSALVAAQATINSQATEIASLRAQLAACQSTTVVTAAPAPVVSAPAPYTAPKRAVVQQKRVVQQQATTTIVPEQLALDDEEYTSSEAIISTGDEQIYTLPSSFYEPGVKGVKLCLRFGGKENRYWPHIGIIDGSMKVDQNIEGNGEKGYNFLLPGAVSSMKGDVGITRDLTFFVSAKIIDRYMLPSDNSLVEIKAPGTGWVARPLTRFGEYYIYRVNQ